MNVIDLTGYKEVPFIKLDERGEMKEGFVVGYRNGKPVELYNIIEPPAKDTDVVLYDKEIPSDISKLLKEQNAEEDDIIISTNGYYTLDALAHNQNKPRSCPIDVKGAQEIKENMRNNPRE